MVSIVCVCIQSLWRLKIDSLIFCVSVFVCVCDDGIETIYDIDNISVELAITHIDY